MSTAPAFRYITGGTLPPDSASYVTRPCDAELLALCRRGEFGYVLSSRQMGKSSLMARTVAALQADEQTTVATIDLTAIGSQQVEAESWFLGVLTEIDSACMPQTDLFSWWDAHKPLPLAQRLWRYITDVLLPEVPGRIVVFVDEIDSTLGLEFTDDFFALIRALHNQRAQQSEFGRLSFVLLGVATPAELIRDSSRTPFNIGQRVEVTDFHLVEARPLLAGLPAQASAQLLDRVLRWTGGQPYLTQKLCALLSAQGVSDVQEVSALVKRELLSEKGRGDPHFQFVNDYLLKTPEPQRTELLDTCADVLSGKVVPCQDASQVHNRLRLAGLMRRTNGCLQYRNDLYRGLFGRRWVRRHQHKQPFWTKANKLLALVAVLVAALMFGLYQRAEQATRQALSFARDATAQRVLSDANDLFGGGGNRPSTAIQSLLMTMAGHRIAQGSATPYVQTAGYAAVQREAARSAPLLWLRENQASITAVAFSPDGAYIVSGSGDQTLRLWDAKTGSFISQPLAGHSSGVTSVAFSPDGARIVSGSSDNTLRLWDAKTGSAIGQPLAGHASGVTSVAFSPDGMRIVSGSLDDTLRLWDARTGRPISQPLAGHTSGVTSVAFSPDGSRIISGSHDKTVRLWDARTGSPIGQPLTGHTSGVTSVAFSPDGMRIVSGSGSIFGDNTLRLWDARTGNPIGQPLAGHTDAVISVDFSSDGTRIVSGSNDKTLRLWDARTGNPIGQPLAGHASGVTSVAFSPDGVHIVSGSEDKTLRLWNARTGHFISQPLAGHTGWVNSITFSPDGTRIVSGSGSIFVDNTLRLWDARTGSAIGQPLAGHTESVRSVAYSPDGTRIVSGSEDKTLRLWDARNGNPIGAPLLGHTGWVTSVAFSPDSRRIVSGGNDKTLRLWDARNGLPIGQPFLGHTSGVTSVAYSADGTRIVSGSNDKTLRLWDARTGRPVGQPFLGHTSWVTSVAFSPDSTRIVSGSEDNTLRLWDARSGSPIGQPFLGHTSWVTSVAFSPDGARIVSGSNDKTLRLWNARTGSLIGQPFLRHTSSVNSVVFSPDGTHIVSGSNDKTLRLWLVPEGWIDALCSKLPRNMSRKEWHEWVSPDIAYIEQCPGKPIPVE